MLRDATGVIDQRNGAMKGFIQSQTDQALDELKKKVLLRIREFESTLTGGKVVVTTDQAAVIARYMVSIQQLQDKLTSLIEKIVQARQGVTGLVVQGQTSGKSLFDEFDAKANAMKQDIATVTKGILDKAMQKLQTKSTKLNDKIKEKYTKLSQKLDTRAKKSKDKFTRALDRAAKAANRMVKVDAELQETSEK
jgi:hypothetical protein